MKSIFKTLLVLITVLSLVLEQAVEVKARESSFFSPDDSVSGINEFIPKSYSHPIPRVGDRPKSEDNSPRSLTFVPITCYVNCVQLNSGTIGYSGSGSASGSWAWRPPITYKREIKTVRVYFLIQGLRIVTSNAGCGISRNHSVAVEIWPGPTLYQSGAFRFCRITSGEVIMPRHGSAG
jgi:hypothetical protein